MKNSAWYQKLWLKKLDKLPVKDADFDWKSMHVLLDEQMPASANPVVRPVYSSGTKLIKILLGYLLPAVIIAGILLYYTLPAFHQSRTDRANKSSIWHAGVVKKANQPNTNDLTRQNSATVDSPEAARSIKDADKSPRVENDTKGSLKALTETNGVATTNPSKQIASLASANNPIKSTSNLAEENYKGKTINSHRPVNAAGNNLTVKRESQRLKQVSQSLRRQSGNSSAIKRQTTASSTGDLKGKNVDASKYSNNSVDSASNVGQKQSTPSATGNKLQPASVSGVVKDINPEAASPSPVTNNGAPGKTSNNNLAAVQNGTTVNINKGKAYGPPKVKTVKNKLAKNKQYHEIITPRYNYGLEAGLSTGAGNSTSFYLGGFGAYAIKPRLLINVGIRINSDRTISGRFTHVSYHGQDSLPPFAVVDSRKLLVADIPVTLEYKLFNALSIKAGALFILPVKQSGINTKLAPIAYARDTLYHTQEINTALNNTMMNKVNLGFTGEISWHIKKFDINGSYQVLKPYKISDALGSYSKTYQTFQLGIGWRFR